MEEVVIRYVILDMIQERKRTYDMKEKEKMTQM